VVGWRVEEVVEKAEEVAVLLMEEVEVLRCNRRRLEPRDFGESDIHIQLVAGNLRMELLQVVLGRPKADHLRLGEQVACHMMIAVGNHSCCHHHHHHHDRRLTPREERHWSLDDLEGPNLQERLQQMGVHVPKALDHRQLGVGVGIHQSQLRCAVEDRLDDLT
jgi:hypothetical protein